MLTEYDGEPVAGGTYPAEIFKRFVTAWSERVGGDPGRFASPPYLGTATRYVVRRVS